MSLLILFFALVYLVLASWRLDWAVMILLAALPSYLIRFNIFGLPFTLLELMIWLVFLVWLVSQTEFKKYLFEPGRLKRFYENKAKRIAYPFGLEIILLLVVSFVAAAIAGFGNQALGIWKAYLFEPALLYIVVMNVFRHNTNDTNSMRMTRMDGVEKIIWALGLSALAVSALAIYQKVTGNLIDNPVWAAVETRRVVSFFGYPNAVGLYLGPIVLIMLGWLFSVIARSRASGETTKQSLVKLRVREIVMATPDLAKRLTSLPSVARNDIIAIIFISLTIVASVLSIYFAKSKGALTGVTAALIIFGLLASKKVRWATIIIIVLASVILTVHQPVRVYFFDKIALRDLSGQIRRQQWQETWQMLVDGRLITGAGLANYQQAITPYHQEGIFVRDFHDPDFQRKVVFNQEFKEKVWQPVEIYLYPHNIFLNFWSELGLAGLLLFVWIIGKFFYTSVKIIKQPVISYKLLVMGLIGAMIVIIVHGLVDVPYFKNDLAVLFWLLVAMMSLINLERQFNVNKS